VADPLSIRGVVERPVHFRAGPHTLFGVLTEPPNGGGDVGVVLAMGGAYVAAPNRNRLSVRMARALAAWGCRTIRFDYHGVGESTGTIDGYWLDRPFVEDLVGAVDVLRSAGVRRIILIGSCFGARTILAAADRVPELAGAMLISTPVRDFQMGDNVPDQYARDLSVPELLGKALRSHVWRNLFAPGTPQAFLRSRRLITRTAVLKLARLLRGPRGDGRARGVSDRFRAGLVHLHARRTPLLFLYGQEENFYEEFERARRGELRDLLTGPEGTVTVEIVEGVVHGFTTLAVQEQVMARGLSWVQTLALSTAQTAPTRPQKSLLTPLS